MVYYRALICFSTYLMLVIATEIAKKPCDVRKCRRAPLTHYTSLKCGPEYANPGDCCPTLYNCDYLYDRYFDKHNICIINGNKYSLGEKLRDDDSILCEEDCTCKQKNLIADFECKTRKKCPPYQRSRPGCYQQNPLQECCSTKEICLNNTKAVTECFVSKEGQFLSYLPGEYIRKPLMYEKDIGICEGSSMNSTSKVYPRISSTFKLKHWSDVHATAGFYRDCAPVYLLNEQGMIGLRTETWRCQKPSDRIIPKSNVLHGDYKTKICDGPIIPNHSAPGRNESLETVRRLEHCRFINPNGTVEIPFSKYRTLCKYGQMSMHIDDVLNRIPYGHRNNSCIVCTCEVPPVPTCVIHQDKPCDQYMHCSEKDIIDGKCT